MRSGSCPPPPLSRQRGRPTPSRRECVLSVPCLPPLYVASRRRTTGWPAAREVGPQPSQQMQTVPRKCAIPPGNAVASHYARNWYRPMRQHSGIGVLDKAMGVLHAVAEEPCSLTELCARTGLPRATAHRLAVGLEVHRLLTRDSDGQWCPGPGLAELAATANDPLIAAAGLILPPRLREITGESVQLYRREGTQRICVASMEPPTGLRDTVLVGADCR